MSTMERPNGSIPQTAPTTLSGLHIRNMRRDELTLAIEWAAREGWNPGYCDAQCFYEADPSGFFMATYDGEPVGTVSAVVYDDAFAFIGLYIVKPEFRGRGFGMQLFQHALDYAGECNVGADGVVDMIPKYEKLGFRVAHRNFRYEGNCAGDPSIGVMDLRHVPFDAIEACDLEHFPSPRPRFLQSWIRQPGAVSLGFVEKGKLRGFGVMRQCRFGRKIGPLFADSETIAESLFSAFCHRADGDTVILDIPETNPAAMSLVQRHGMRKCFETARIYTRNFPDIHIGGVYGITSFELG